MRKFLIGLIAAIIAFGIGYALLKGVGSGVNPKP